jgi:DNA-binding LacI/PurR family transcriptional regulator
VFLDGYEGMRQLYAKGLAIDCLVCGDDAIAFGAMKFCREKGVSVPGRLAIAGFDDVPGAGLSNPSLTSVGQPLRAMGRKAFSMLLEGIESGSVALRCETAKPSLSERESA